MYDVGGGGAIVVASGSYCDDRAVKWFSDCGETSSVDVECSGMPTNSRTTNMRRLVLQVVYAIVIISQPSGESLRADVVLAPRLRAWPGSVLRGRDRVDDH